MNSITKREIFGLKISSVDINVLLNIIADCIKSQKKILITYANSAVLNLAEDKSDFKTILGKFDIIHPDGIGVYLASKLIYGKEGFPSRISGSDFYQQLLFQAVQKKRSFYFFGDRNETLKQISKVNPKLTIKGMQNGFDFSDEKLITEINDLKPDILVVGLGSPKQESWIIKHKSNLDVNVIIAFGDGIKIFSSTKRRGPKLIRLLGFEWAVRLFFEPKRLWKRYLLGIPLFIFRILKYKLVKN